MTASTLVEKYARQYLVQHTEYSALAQPLSSAAEANTVLPGEILNIITGDSGNNRLVGSALSDEINAGDGDDILISNGGQDRLSGGSGSDRFQFKLGESTPAQMATVTDFVDGNWNDSIEFIGLAGYNFSHFAAAFSSLDAGLAAVRALPVHQLTVFTVTSNTTHTYIYAAATASHAETLIQLENHDGKYLNRHSGDIRTLLTGGNSDDIISHSGSLDSYIDAGDGDDILRGGSKFDYIIAGAGSDTIDGGAGEDTLDTTATGVVINDSGATLNVNGTAIASSTVIDIHAMSSPAPEQDHFTNIEGVRLSDAGNYVALGSTLRHAEGAAGDDLFLFQPDQWGTVQGLGGHDRFVFKSAASISPSTTQVLDDFDPLQDQLIFVTQGNYQLASQLFEPEPGIRSTSLILEQIRNDPALANQLVGFRFYSENWLFINGNGGTADTSLHNTMIQLPGTALDDMTQLSAAISFTTEVPSTIAIPTTPKKPTTPDEVIKVFDEPDSGSIDNYFLLSTNRAATEAVTLWYETTGGTATAGTDYEAVSGWVTIAAGQASAAIGVQVYGDTLAEVDETIQMQISDPSGRWLASGVTLIAEHTIMDNDLFYAL